MVGGLGRVYPLHIVMLLVMLLFRFVRIGLVMAGIVVAMPAAFEVNNAYSFFLNVFLLHSLGFVDYLSWNAPSWSISVEFYTYLIFGLVLVLAQRFGSKRYFYACAVLLGVGSWLALVVAFGGNGIGAQNDLGMPRCITTFFLGGLTGMAVSQDPRNLVPALQSGVPLSALVSG